MAMESALSEGEGWCPYYTVATMRDVVASSMSEETYQMYALMHQQQAEGAEHLPAARIHSRACMRVRAVRHAMRPRWPSLPDAVSAGRSAT